MARIYSNSIDDSPRETSSSAYEDNDGLTLTDIHLHRNNTLLVMLTVPDTYNVLASMWSHYRIIAVGTKADGTEAEAVEIVRGLFDGAVDGQRIPIALQCTLQGTDTQSPTTIKAQWKTKGGTLNIGRGKAVLTAVRIE